MYRNSSKYQSSNDWKTK